MTDRSFLRVESRLTIAISSKTEHDFAVGMGDSALFSDTSIRLPVSDVQVVERLGELPVAMATLVLGTKFGDDFGDTDTHEFVDALHDAVDNQYIVAICLETVVNNLQTDEETKEPEEVLFVGFIMSPTKQLMRKDTGAQIQLRHYGTILANAAIMSHFAIETPENRFASAALWSGQGANQGLRPGTAELIVSRLDLPKDMVARIRDRDVFHSGPVTILKAFAEKSVPKILQQNWSSCSNAVNEPSEAVKNFLDVIGYLGAIMRSEISQGGRQLIARKMEEMLCKRTLADFAGGTFWDKLQQYASFLDVVMCVHTYGVATSPTISINARPLNIAAMQYIDAATGHITDLRWQANTNIKLRGVVLASTSASPTNLALPEGMKTYGCYIDNTDPNKGSVKHMAPPAWLVDVWVSGVRAGNASNYSVSRGGVVGKPSSNQGKSTDQDVAAIKDFGRDEFKSLLDAYAKWIYLQIAYMGRTVTYSTQYRKASSAEDYVQKSVKLNDWVKLDTDKINTRFTRTTKLGVLYGLVVGKTTVLSRSSGARTVNYQLDYVMTGDEYDKYQTYHPLYRDLTDVFVLVSSRSEE